MASQGYSGFGGAQGYAAGGAYGQQPAGWAAQPQGYGAGYGQYQGYGATAAYGQPQGYTGYGQSQGYGAAAQPQYQAGAAGAWAPLGAGYGQRHVAPAEVQAQYRGKPAFYDAPRGVLYDGKVAYYYAPAASSSTPYGQPSTYTAIETTPSGATRITVGNGTHGDIYEHRANVAAASNYAYEGAGYRW